MPVHIKYTRPWLYKKQEDAIFYPRDPSGALAPYSFIEASTKSGKTAGCILWLMEIALFGKPGNHYWWVAPISSQARIAYDRMRRYFPPGLVATNSSLPSITINNGCTIEFKSADNPDSLYGQDVYAAVIDEASRTKAEAWIALLTTLTATGGPIRAIGNVKGRKNWFYRESRDAERGSDGSSYHKIIADDAIVAGLFTQDKMEQQRKHMSEDAFNELYYAEAIAEDGNPFGEDHINACVMTELEKGQYAPGPAVAFGWDLAKKIDYTCGIALNKHGQVCKFHHFRKPWKETLEFIRKETGRTKALIDSTGVGDPITEFLQREGNSNIEGYLFSNRAKQQLMEGLAVGIQQGKVRYPEGRIVDELQAFEYHYTPSGLVSYRNNPEQSKHDDCVTALGLAWEQFNRRGGMRVWEAIGAQED